MDKPKVSVVMPSKNAAEYIDACLKSVEAQTLKTIEILCVDAMSTDGTREIIQKHQEKDARIKLLDDDKGSSGYADNKGFKHAAGDYVAIVETDDLIKPDMMEKLYAVARADDLDYVKANFSIFIEKNGVRLAMDQNNYMKKLAAIYDRVISTKDYPEILNRDGYMWKGIYKRDFIIKNNLWLNETKGAAYQDNGFLHKTIINGRRVKYIKECFYQYRRDNVNCSAYSKNGLNMMLKEYEYIDGYMKNSEAAKPFMKNYYYKLFHQFRAQYRKTGNNFSENAHVVGMFMDMLREGYKNGLIDPLVWNIDYLDFLLLLRNPEVYLTYDVALQETLMAAYRELLAGLKNYNSEIVVVSAGERGKALYLMVAEYMDGDGLWICDNSRELQGTNFGYHGIESVEQAAKKHRDAVFIIENELHNIELHEQLIKLEVPESRILDFRLPIDAYIATSWAAQKRTEI